jgi:hypothetical protein
MAFKPPTLPKKQGDAAALQAVAKGIANDGQQRAAIKCIVEELCATYEMSYDPDGKHAGFNEGRRAVGRALVGTFNTSLPTIVDAEKRLKVRRQPKKKG